MVELACVKMRKIHFLNQSKTVKDRKTPKFQHFRSVRLILFLFDSYVRFFAIYLMALLEKNFVITLFGFIVQPIQVKPKKRFVEYEYLTVGYVNLEGLSKILLREWIIINRPNEYVDIARYEAHGTSYTAIEVLLAVTDLRVVARTVSLEQ